MGLQIGLRALCRLSRGHLFPWFSVACFVAQLALPMQSERESSKLAKLLLGALVDTGGTSVRAVSRRHTRDRIGWEHLEPSKRD